MPCCSPFSGLPDEEDHRGGEQCAHREVEGARRALGAQEALENRAEGEPREAAWQGREDEDQPEGSRLAQRAARPLVEKGRGSAGADQPRLRIDPLKRGGADESDRLPARREADAAGGGDLPGEPTEESCTA